MVLIASRRLSSPKREHLFRRIDFREEWRCCLVYALVGGLCRKHDGDQKRKGVPVLEFRTRIWIRAREAREKLFNFRRFERPDHAALYAAIRGAAQVERNNPQLPAVSNPGS